MIDSNCAFQKWKDYHLVWDPSEFENLSVIQASPGRIWSPDIAIYNEYVCFSLKTNDELVVTIPISSTCFINAYIVKDKTFSFILNLLFNLLGLTHLSLTLTLTATVVTGQASRCFSNFTPLSKICVQSRSSFITSIRLLEKGGNTTHEEHHRSDIIIDAVIENRHRLSHSS